jgi:hypothetical protein
VGQERLDPRPGLPDQLGALLAQQGFPDLDELPLADIVGVSFSAVTPPAGLFSGGLPRVELVLQMAEAEAAARLAELGAQAGWDARGGSIALWHDGPFVVLLAGGAAEVARTPAAELEARLFGEAPSLVDSPYLRTGDERFSPAGGVTVIDGFSRLDEGEPGSRWLPPALDPLTEILRGSLGGNLGVVLSGGRFRMQLRGGRFVTESFRVAVGEAGDEAWGEEPIDAARLDLLPPEAVIGGLLRVDPADLADLFALGSNQMLAAAGQGVLDDFERTFGFRPDRDLFAPLAGPVAFGLAPFTGPSAPDIRLVCRLGDREGFLRGMDGVLRLVEAKGRGQVEARSSEYRKVPIYTFSYSGVKPAGQMIDVTALIKPSLVVLPDRVVFTLSSRHAKDEVRRLTRDEAVEASSAMSALSSAPLPEDAMEIGFADWLGLFSRLYDSIKSLAPLAAGFGYELPFDPEQLPESQTFTRFFEPAFHWTRRVDGGVLTFSESSLGPEMPLLLGSMAGMALVPLVGTFSSAPAPTAAPPPELAEPSETREDGPGVH